MLIAVTGATGHFGKSAIENLRRHVPAASVVALARDPAKAGDLGVDVRLADYDRPETLGPALAGVDRLLFVSGTEVGARVRQHRNVIDAAVAAGVTFIAYTSVLHAETGPADIAADHRATEEAIKASGIPYAFLRNGWYMENYLGSVAGAVAGGAVLGSAGDGKVSAALRADYAQAAAVVVAGEGHVGATYELAADDAFTMSDFAAEISRQVGRTIPYRNLAEGDYAKALEGFGLPPAVAKTIASYDADVARGALFDDSRTLSRLIGRPTTPLSEGVATAIRAMNAA